MEVSVIKANFLFLSSSYPVRKKLLQELFSDCVKKERRMSLHMDMPYWMRTVLISKSCRVHVYAATYPILERKLLVPMASGKHC